MTNRPRAPRVLLLLCCLAGPLAPLGCGDDGLGTRYPVSGKVTYNGQPLEKGEITFMPAASDGRGAVGVIANGSYKLTTQSPDDGAFPGDYNVVITALTVDASKVEADTKKAAEKAKVETSMPDQAAVGRATASAKNAIPAKYGQVASSGLKAKVEAKSNTFDFPLTD